MKRWTVAALTLAALTGCGGSSGEDVQWTKYPAGLQQRIDGSGDCRELQELFDAMADMDDAVRKREGSGTGDVLGYIDDRLEAAGCYR